MEAASGSGLEPLPFNFLDPFSMRNSLLLACILAATFSATAKDNLKGKVVCEADGRPVANAILSVEYPDTIVSYEADRKGRFKFEPSSYPLTIAARGEGMTESVIGLMSKPDSKLVIELAPDPSAATKPASKRKPDWSTAMRRRLSSTYIVRSSK